MVPHVGPNIIKPPQIISMLGIPSGKRLQFAIENGHL